MMQDVLMYGDRFRLTEAIGPDLPAGSIGVVVRAYEPMPLFTTGGGAVDTTCPRYGAIFPILREKSPHGEPWAPEGIDLDGLVPGPTNVVPICEHEVEVLDNMTKGGGE